MLVKMILMLMLLIPNTDTTVDDFRQDLEIKVTKVSMGAETKK